MAVPQYVIFGWREVRINEVREGEEAMVALGLDVELAKGAKSISREMLGELSRFIVCGLRI